MPNPKNVSEDEIREIYQGLKDRYGEAPEPSSMSGVDYLVETILSQNTNDINRDKAFKQLKEKYDSWEKVEKGDYEELVDTIRVAGLGPTKAERIQEALRITREREDEYSIEFLNDMSVEEGKKWLTDIPGIGPKTAAVILCFHFKKPVIPVDTHVHRISKRFELVPEKASRTKSHDILEEIVPDEIKYGFHRLLITHGRETCKSKGHVDNENCFERCKYYREVVIGGKDPKEFV
ncbi:endonuclease III domain-containing protein [Candidatus Nanosalina sp. VS9-1]|uniref:endonuclease III domain-containing protein n=1 Tax=Candidatus Nanosalina sp. VS9-1 TaxID=3388566 RepID=UPI0039E045E6